MNKHAKELWLAALDTHIQGTHALQKTRNSYCCLGVLCQVFKEDTGIGKWEYDTGEGCYIFITDEESEPEAHYLPEAVRKWAGISESNPEVEIVDGFMTLSLLNDEGSTFAQIKELIEAQY